MTSSEIAYTIRDQIKALDPWALMAWGVDQMSLIYAQNPASGMGDAHLGGLSFRHRGAKMKGYVWVCLDPSDTYRVYFYKGLSNSHLVKEVRDVYVEDLVNVIDSEIER